jgi:hypothetical protein
MLKFRALVGAALLVAMAVSAPAADEVIEAIDQARKSYQSGDLANAKQALDLASQLIGQKNAERFRCPATRAVAGVEGGEERAKGAVRARAPFAVGVRAAATPPAPARSRSPSWPRVRTRGRGNDRPRRAYGLRRRDRAFFGVQPLVTVHIVDHVSQGSGDKYKLRTVSLIAGMDWSPQRRSGGGGGRGGDETMPPYPRPV